jgi:hypothetical protein
LKESIKTKSSNRGNMEKKNIYHRYNCINIFVGMLKSIIGAVNHNEKQEEEEVGLPPSSDRKGGNTNNNPPLFSELVFRD